MLRWQRCVSAHCYLIFCYSHLHKQEGFGGGFDFLLPPEMCPDGCAGDGCLRNQQNLPCLARAEPLVLPEQGRSKAGTNVLAAKWKVFLLCTQQELHMEWSIRSPASTSPFPGQQTQVQMLPARVWPSQEEPFSLQAEGRWVFTKRIFYCIKQFSLFLCGNTNYVWHLQFTVLMFIWSDLHMQRLLLWSFVF